MEESGLELVALAPPSQAPRQKTQLLLALSFYTANVRRQIMFRFETIGSTTSLSLTRPLMP